LRNIIDGASDVYTRRTDLVEHLVALVQDKVLAVVELEVTAVHQIKDAPGGAHNNVLWREARRG